MFRSVVQRNASIMLTGRLRALPRVPVVQVSSSTRFSSLSVRSFSTVGSSKSTSAVSHLPTQAKLSQPKDSNEPYTVHFTAFCISSGIDLKRISKLFTMYNCSNSRSQQRKYISYSLSEPNQHFYLYRYGAVVFCNVPEHVRKDVLNTILSDETGLVVVPFSQTMEEFSESYDVVVQPNLDVPSVLKANHLVIRQLDKPNLEIISTTMAESVTLEVYDVMGDTQVSKFEAVNAAAGTSGGAFNQFSSHELHKLVASNNVIITSVLSRLGLFEGTDATWENGDYYQTWRALRRDFEIESRFNDLQRKMNAIKDDVHFYVQTKQFNQTHKMEMIIIILIAGEFMIGLTSLTLQVMGM